MLLSGLKKHFIKEEVLKWGKGENWILRDQEACYRMDCTVNAETMRIIRSGKTAYDKMEILLRHFAESTPAKKTNLLRKWSAL